VTVADARCLEDDAAGTAAPRWLPAVTGRPAPRRRPGDAVVLGAVGGEGSGPELVAAALGVLEAVAAADGAAVHVLRTAADDPDGMLAACGAALAAGAPVLAGAVGGRFVYDLRARFDLFCKLVPLRPSPVRAAEGPLRAEHCRGVDVLLVRENVSGIYLGAVAERADGGERVVQHAATYREGEVRRIVEVAARLATTRRGRLTVVLKDGGLPAMSALWRDVAGAVARAAGVALDCANVDLAAWRLVQEPRTLDVVVAPNLFGDVLADVGAVLLGGRPASWSGNFAADGAAVYQTNHGAAHDLAGTDRANPLGQLLALAMLLRESLGWDAGAAAVEHAVDAVWAAGFRTPDGTAPGCRVVGTRELAARVADAAARRITGHDAGAAAR
jgi:3-isopropylmalate dehydrogenase